MATLLLGLDVGTTAVKAAAYSPDGRQMAVAEAPSSVHQDRTGASEQNMEQVWRTTADVLLSLVTQCSGHEFDSLGVAAQGDGLWCIDEHGAAVGPALLWNDTRTAADLAAIEAAGATAAIGRGCHTSLWSGTSGMLWRWLRANRPNLAERTAYVLTCADWITFRLTGELATDYSDATIPFLDIATREYGPAQLAALGCEDIRSRLLPPRRADSLLGVISDAASAQTGLPKGLPVAVGTLDLSAMILGMAMDRPGQTMLIMGTTAVVNILTGTLAPSDAPAGASVLHPTSNLTIRALAPTTGAVALDWFVGLHPATIGGVSASEAAERMNVMVGKVPPGSDGVTFLPYLNGERAPFVAAEIRGAFHGLSAMTCTGQMARSVMEGAAFSLRHCFEAVGGLPTAPVQLTGGGARNQVWCGIIADVIGQPVLVSDASDHGLWGAAVLGASASGLGEAVVLARRQQRFTTHPPVRHDQYEQVYSRYLTIVQHHRALQEDLSLIEAAHK